MKSVEAIFEKLTDELGPAKILHLYDHRTKTKGIVVIDNVARGPAIGGVRLAPDIGTEEVFRLARTMTLKNAAAGLPHGGAKAGIIGNPHDDEKETLIRAFARKIREQVEYIPGPDMGTDERCMGYIYDEIGRCIGLPRALGGIPLDEIGATGFGLLQVAELALPFAGLSFAETKLVVQGFGNVGRHAAKFLTDKGTCLVAACDTSGTIYLETGLDVDTLIRAKREKGSVLAYPGGTRLSADEIFQIPCDLFIPAAQPDVITAENAGHIKTKVILEGANIPVTEKAEQMLHDRGILCIPDLIANAGGVICASVEYTGGSERLAFTTIKEKLRKTTGELLALMTEKKLYPRQAAIHLASNRVREAMDFRR